MAFVLASPIIITALTFVITSVLNDVEQNINLKGVAERAATNATLALSTDSDWDAAFIEALKAPTQLGYDNSNGVSLIGEQLFVSDISTFFDNYEEITESDFLAASMITATKTNGSTGDVVSHDAVVVSIKVGSNDPSVCVTAANSNGSDTLKFTGNSDINLPDCGVLLLSSKSDALKLTGSGSSANAIVDIDCVYGIVEQYDVGEISCQTTDSSFSLPYNTYMSNLISDIETFVEDDTGLCRSTSIGVSTPHLCNECLNGVQCTILEGGEVNLDGNYNLVEGMYIFDNTNLSIGKNASLIGDNVTIVLLGNSSISTHSKGEIGVSTDPLTAPSAGDLKGVLILTDSSASVQDIAFPSQTYIRGILYAPSSSISINKLNDTGLANDECAEIVGDTINFQGGSGSEINLRKCVNEDVTGDSFEYKLYTAQQD